MVGICELQSLVQLCFTTSIIFCLGRVKSYKFLYLSILLALSLRQFDSATGRSRSCFVCCVYRSPYVAYGLEIVDSIHVQVLPSLGTREGALRCAIRELISINLVFEGILEVFLVPVENTIESILLKLLLLLLFLLKLHFSIPKRCEKKTIKVLKDSSMSYGKK